MDVALQLAQRVGLGGDRGGTPLGQVADALLQLGHAGEQHAAETGAQQRGAAHHERHDQQEQEPQRHVEDQVDQVAVAQAEQLGQLDVARDARGDQAVDRIGQARPGAPPRRPW
ncbi:hypothetical protein ACFSTC_18625 [Nonomuraea ferruginea]